MYIRGFLILSFGSLVAADLRMASQPRFSGYGLVNQGTTPWNVTPWENHMHYRYMEPSTFNYKGLKHQKARNYDNFLRSNIDNEQDNRNFNEEDGKDHLPFRTFEANVFDEYGWHHYYHTRRRVIHQPKAIEIPLMQAVKPGESMLVPLRWNNPHSSEMEVNVWIFEHGAGKKPIVVPIRKPSCSGEGYQDNIISFTVPKDFAKLGSKIPGFKGCNEDMEKMCTLQIYSHSVESRTYAIGFPIVIPGHDASLTAKNSDGIEDASIDPWLDLESLRDICLPATDPSATITSAKPRWARLVSDVYNHAYQNSDYSPYSGQQHEHISKNLQASAINKMVVGNRGELGKSILPRDTSRKLAYLRKLEDGVYKNYESLANKIIKELAPGSTMINTGKVGRQPLATCFRCKEVGTTNTNRLTTNTYIPSFQLPKDLIPKARALVPEKYQRLITEGGLVQIYVASLNDLLPFFYESQYLGIIYQDAIVKTTVGTMPDATKFKKKDADGKIDHGKYASIEAKKAFVAERGCPSQCLFAKAEGLLPEEDTSQKVVKAEPCTGDDCLTTAICPSGTSPQKCLLVGRYGDGMRPDGQACNGYGGHESSKVTAYAFCEPSATYSAVSDELFLDNSEVSASCPDGGTPISCTCHSSWRSCPKMSFAPSGSTCKLTIGRASGHRRRGSEKGIGAKVYALCAGEAAPPTPAPPVMTWLDLKGLKASQSSEGHRGNPSRAIDGNANTFYNANSCTHTRRETGPWWQVDLGSKKSIQAVEVTNRGDCCGSRLNGFSVLVDGEECASNVPIIEGEKKVVPCSAVGQVLRVTVNKREQITLCEVRVAVGQATSVRPRQATPVSDTPGWANPKYGCADYASMGWCKDGGFVPGKEWTGGSKFNYPEKNCKVCGKAPQATLLEAPCGAADSADVNTFASKEQMEAAGWSFGSSDDKYVFKPKGSYQGYAKASSYWGFKHPGSLDISLPLSGKGSLTLSFGNSWTEGRVEVFLNDDLKDTAPARSVSKSVTIPFQNGDVLKITENHAVAVINSVTFHCTACTSSKDCQQDYMCDTVAGFCKVAVSDTPGWKNPKYGCADYESQGWCKDGGFVKGQEWTGGSKYNYPENNCIVCGKSSQAATAAPSGKCRWSEYPEHYSPGWAGGIKTRYTLPRAKVKCLQLGSEVCKAVTCQNGNPDDCYVGAGGVGLLRERSYSTTYVPSAGCKLAGTIENPLVPNAWATNTTGVCAHCVQFFGKEVHVVKEPALTPLAQQIQATHHEPANIGNLRSNPDDDKPTPIRRRRRGPADGPGN